MVKGMLCDNDDDGDSCPDTQDAFPRDPQGCEAGKQKAIVVVGGGPYAGNYLWEATEAMAEFAIAAIESQVLRGRYLLSECRLWQVQDPDGDVTENAIRSALFDGMQSNDPLMRCCFIWWTMAVRSV